LFFGGDLQEFERHSNEDCDMYWLNYFQQCALFDKERSLNHFGGSGDSWIYPKPFMDFCGFGERRLGLILQNCLSIPDGKTPSSIQQLAQKLLEGGAPLGFVRYLWGIFPAFEHCSHTWVLAIAYSSKPKFL